MYHPQFDEQQEYQNRFSGDRSCHLPFAINGQPAFFVKTESMHDLVYEILRQNNRIGLQSGKLSGNNVLTMLLKTCIYKEIEQSNELEHINSSRKELAVLEREGQLFRNDHRFAGQLRQYQALLERKISFPQSSSGIREIFDQLLARDFRNDKMNLPDGRIFRKDPVSITNGSQAVHQGVIPEEEIIRILDETIELVSSLQTPIAASVFHFVFEFVHPFYDGNGRMGRFLTTLQLSEDDLHLAGLLQLSLKLRQDRSLYYWKFKECEDPRNRGEITSFVLFFLEEVLAAMEEGCEMLEMKNAQFVQGQKRIEGIRPKNGNERNFLQCMLEAALFEVQVYTLKQIEEMLKISESTAKKLVKKYQGILFTEKEGKHYLYSLHYDFIEEKGENRNQIA